MENLGLRGLSVRTSCDFEQGDRVEVELKSKYAAPVNMRARVKWVTPLECEEASYAIGLSIYKIRIFDWFRFMRIIAQIKKEVW